MSKKLSRRDFARTSVAAGAAAVTLPSALLGKEVAPATTSAAAVGAAAARRLRATMPPDVGYGGVTLDGRGDVMLADTLTPAGQPTPSYPSGWREGTTIPQEYYIEERHYLNDERYIKEHFWLMIDHESRIPKPGDYFIFQYGRGDSAIVVRDRDGVVKGFHNVCRHRGSRLCVSSDLLPTEAGEKGTAPDAKFSVVQLGPSGNTPVFRCPYHAWTYDTSGKLISIPPGIPSGFDQSQHGLHPVHLRTMEGLIFVNFAEDQPPDFDDWVAGLRPACKEIGTAQLKIAARRSVPTKANWKLVIENFRECYHCQPGHGKSYITAHWWGDQSLTPAQRAQIEREILREGHQPGGENYLRDQGILRDRLVDLPNSGTSMAYGRNHLRPGYVTGSVDGQPVAPLLPGLKEYTHRTRGGGASGMSTASISAYDDFVRCTRFTPRGVMSTDAEAFWLVHPDAKMSPADIERMVGIWYNTLREDRWLAENNHHGILSSRYAYKGGQPYMASEGGPAGFVKWYMSEVVPRASSKQTSAG